MRAKSAAEAPGIAEATAACGLELRLFGHMEVWVRGRPLPHVRTRKGLWLLALLALRQEQTVDRTWLAGTLWPDGDETGSLRSLRQSLHDLRLALGDAAAARITSPTPRTLRLDLTGASVDALAFDAAIRRGDREALERSICLYRGPLLEDCSDDWCLLERQRRAQEYAAALRQVAALASDGGDGAAAVRYLRLAVDAAPLREDLWRALMTTLAQAGDIAGGLEAYRDLRSLLWREMNADPAPETTALFRQIREEMRRRAGIIRLTSADAASPARGASVATPSAALPRIRHLPVPLTPLIGRDADVREVCSLLARCRLVSLVGAGGIGKTRLAIRVAEEAEPEFEDGAWFVSLASLADPGRVPVALRDALGMSKGSGREEPLAALKRHLARRQMLLVLDNCEHLSASCAALAEALLGACPGLRILATSRQRLVTRGETAWRVPSLALPPPAEQNPAIAPAVPIPLFPAVQLFVERARAAETAFMLTCGNAPAVVEVCRRLDGIPLAIELAAARVRALSVEEIAARLRGGFGLLQGGEPAAAAASRHNTLASVFQWSWDLLSAPERALLARLSVFAGGWTLDAAEIVCAGDGIAQEDVLDLLTSLIDKSLVVFLPADAKNGDARYHCLETVRQFAADRLRAGDGDIAARTRDRHRDFFLDWAALLWPRLWGPEQGVLFDRLEAEHDNLRAALAWCRQQNDYEKELRLATALGRFWDTRGHLREGRGHLETAISHATPGTPADLRANAHTLIGWMADVQGDYALAESHWRNALALYEELGNDKNVASLLNFLACAAYHSERLDEARSLFEASLDMHRRKLANSRPASVINNMGEVALRQGDLETARRCFEECAALCEASGSQQLHGITLCNLALTDLREGLLGAAEAHNAAAIRLLHACGAVIDLCQPLDQAALLAYAQGQWERTVRLLSAADALRESVGVPSCTLLALERDATYAAVRDQLDLERFAGAQMQGGSLSAEAAAAEALATASLGAARDSPLLQRLPGTLAAGTSESALLSPH